MPASLLIGATTLVAAMSTGIESKKAPGPTEGWDGAINFNASSATGNTENFVLGASLEGRKVAGRWTQDVAAGVNYTETTDDDTDESEVTQNNWFVQYRVEARTSERTFVYARTRYEEDEFSGFDQRIFLGGGVGAGLLETPNTRWDVLIGPGIQYTTFSSPDDPVPDDFEDEETELAIYAGSDLAWTIRENVSLTHDFDVTWTEENTSVASLVALKSKLTERMSTRLSYEVGYETEPVEGRESTDTQLSAGLSIGF